MSLIKESLINTIKLLSDEEARHVLEFAKSLRKKSKKSKESNVSLTLKRLASDPTFKIPSILSKRDKVFSVVKPIRGKGIATSKLLVEDRR